MLASSPVPPRTILLARELRDLKVLTPDDHSAIVNEILTLIIKSKNIPTSQF